MNVLNVTKPQQRIATDVDFTKVKGVQAYGDGNQYPQQVRDIVNASGTATLCLSRFRDFVEGFGFRDETFASAEVGRYGETMDDLLRGIADDLTRYNGFALLVNYDVLGNVTTLQNVPFENCRLGEADDHNEVREIIVHDDWSGRTHRRGQAIRVDESNVRRYPVFNANPTVVQAQMDAVGGVAHYRGQILWYSGDGRWTYPTPIYDAAITEISTDEGLGNVKYRNVRNNFLISAMIVTKANAPVQDYDVDAQYRHEQEATIADNLAEFQGDTKAGVLMSVQIENAEDKPEVIPFPSRNFDKEFSETTHDTTERIYAQFGQELFHAIRIGKLGFSGDVMRDAYEYYAGKVTTEQRIIERVVTKVMAHHADVTLRSRDYSIAPLKYINSEQNGAAALN